MADKTETTTVERSVPENASYEELVRELEASVARLEAGDLPLEEAVLEYEFGMKIITECNAMLDRAELRVTELAEGASNTSGNDSD
jgi:exodeoxyribonuclease VII small subunit